MEESIIKNNERIENIQFGDLKLIQNLDWFCYGVDAVLLADFCRAKRGWRIADLGTGTGIIPLILHHIYDPSHIIGIEIQDEVADMARRSVLLNNLQDTIQILNMDLNEAPQKLTIKDYDLVVSNPPYMAKNEGIINTDDIKALSRHEIKASVEDVIAVAYDLLKPHGHFCLVHRPHRLVDILYLCRKYRLEPKKIRFVHPNKNKKPNIMLLHCTKYGKPELKFMDPLYVYDENGDYSEEIYRIYRRK
mgnify:CR=1 FL=1